VIGNAVKVMRLATCKETAELETDRAKSAAAKLGSRRGKARAANLTPEWRRGDRGENNHQTVEGLTRRIE
jgi:hypothetical protein